jgi:RNA polymerase sigma-70 factor (ECF subfamily)
MVRNVVRRDDAGLIRLSQRGDKQAFAELVDRHWDRLYRWLYHLAHDSHEAEDAAQEAFLRAFRNITAFEPRVSFQAWLFRIAHNVYLNAQRPRKRARQPMPDDLPSRESDPAEVILSREAMQHLMRGVGRLPTEFRGPFLLRVEEELSFAEIADILEITEETARWRVYKARQKLLEVMQPFLTESP